MLPLLRFAEHVADLVADIIADLVADLGPQVSCPVCSQVLKYRRT